MKAYEIYKQAQAIGPEAVDYMFQWFLGSVGCVYEGFTDSKKRADFPHAEWAIERLKEAFLAIPDDIRNKEPQKKEAAMSDGKHDVHECVDRDFVFELCKRGHVHVFSTQVSIHDEIVNLKGVVMPKGCEIEYVHAIRGRTDERPEVSITFGWPNE